MRGKYQLRLVKGRDGAGNPFFAYVLTTPEIIAHAEALSELPSAPDAYGIVLLMRYGNTPSAEDEAEAKRILEETYLRQ